MEEKGAVGYQPVNVALELPDEADRINNLSNSVVKEDKNFNFLKDNSFVSRPKDCVDTNVETDRCRELGKETEKEEENFERIQCEGNFGCEHTVSDSDVANQNVFTDFNNSNVVAIEKSCEEPDVKNNVQSSNTKETELSFERKQSTTMDVEFDNAISDSDGTNKYACSDMIESGNENLLDVDPEINAKLCEETDGKNNVESGNTKEIELSSEKIHCKTKKVDCDNVISESDGINRNVSTDISENVNKTVVGVSLETNVELCKDLDGNKIVESDNTKETELDFKRIQCKTKIVDCDYAISGLDGTNRNVSRDMNESVNKTIVNVNIARGAEFGGGDMRETIIEHVTVEDAGKSFVEIGEQCEVKSKKWSIGTPIASTNDRRWSFKTSTPCQTGSYFTPAKTVLKRWKPSLCKRSSMFSSEIAPAKSKDGNPNQAAISLQETINEDDTEDDFQTSLMKLQMKIEEIEKEENVSLPSRNKDCSKLEAYHKTVVGEREEDCEKLDEILADMSNQVAYMIENDDQKSNVVESLPVSEFDKLEPIVEDPENDGTNRTIDIDSKQNTVKETDEKQDKQSVEEIERVEGNDCDFAKEGDNTIIEIPVGDSFIQYKSKSDMTIDLIDSDDEKEDILSLSCSETIESVGEVVDSTSSSAAPTTTSSSQASTLESSSGEFKVAATTPRKPSVDVRSADFVSHDPMENQDNNDPEWEIWKRISSDKERYKALRQRWRSLTIPNPNEDLTCHNYRAKRLKRNAANTSKKSKPNLQELNSRKRKRQSTDSADEPDAKKRKCTVVFNMAIDDLLKKLENKRFKIHTQMNRELIAMAERQETETYNCLYMRKGDYAALLNRQSEDVRNLTAKFNRQLDVAEKETADYVNLLRAATEEVNTFHKFYENLDSENAQKGSIFLSADQIQDLLEAEIMLEDYQHYYGN